MLLLPVMIWAQNSVIFDFSSPSSDDVVPTVMEKDGVYLKFSATKADVTQPNYTRVNNLKCLKIDVEGILTIESFNSKITSIKFTLADNKDDLKFYLEEVGKIGKRTISHLNRKIVERNWKG